MSTAKPLIKHLGLHFSKDILCANEMVLVLFRIRIPQVQVRILSTRTCKFYDYNIFKKLNALITRKLVENVLLLLTTTGNNLSCWK
jgi:hypothetical protein